MGFKLSDSFYERKREIHEKKYIDFKGENIHVSDFEDRSITAEMKKQMRMNSYAQDDLPPKLDNNALIETAEYYITNCRRPSFPCTTYDESLIHVILPELIKRLKEV